MKRFLQTALTSVYPRGQKGGVAIIMLLGFIVLAVPLTQAAIQTAGQLSRNSKVYDARLAGAYGASAGIEVAIHKILSDPTFDDDLSPGNPSKDITVDANGDTVTVTVTKIFSTATVQGQGIVLSKVLSPTSGPAGGASPLTYTITLKNEGTSPVYLQEIRDELPPGASYDPGSTTGLTTDDPSVADGPTFETDFFYLNDRPGPPPYDWETTIGTDQATGSYTPAQNSWEEVPEYWNSLAFATAGLLPATSWIHRQRIKTAQTGNKFRFKVQVKRGASVIDLFTSADIDASTTWKYGTISHSAGNYTVEIGDRLRLRLEVWSNEINATDRLFDYRWGGAVDYQSRTNVPALFVGDCSDDPSRLTWTFSPDIQIDGQQNVTLTFVAHAAFDDGTYYNQANAKYDPWWDSSPVVVWTPYTAEYTAGTGTPTCGNDLDVLVTKDVVPQSAVPGVETEFTYTVTLENTSATDRYICEIEDVLPPEYTYVLGSSGDYPSNMDTFDPDEKWLSTPERWRLEWGDGKATTTPLVTLTPGETRTQVFRATATVEPGINYYNEINAGYALSLEPGGGCLSSGTGQGGASGQSSVATPSLYDIQAVASDGSIQSRIVVYESLGDIEILSWQEY